MQSQRRLVLIFLLVVLAASTYAQWVAETTHVSLPFFDVATPQVDESVVLIQVVDVNGVLRSDWIVQVLYGDIIVAQGAGQVQAALPRTDIVGNVYKVRVVTNAVTPHGKTLVKEETLELKQKAFVLRIPVSTVKVTLQAVDGFGAVRSDWPVVVENVASGMGQITTELVEGQQYVVRVTGLGFTNTTSFTAKGPQMVIHVKIPTAKIVAQAVDGFGNVRSDWSVQIVGVSSGQGTVGPVEVLGGQQYTVKTVVFGKEFSQTVNVPVGQTITATVQVPTAKLSVTAVDDDKKPIDDKYVTSVKLDGTLQLAFFSPPKEVELPEGTYNIEVTALGKMASTSVVLKAGETKGVTIVIPGTAGIYYMGERIPLPVLAMFFLLLLITNLITEIIKIRLQDWHEERKEKKEKREITPSDEPRGSEQLRDSVTVSTLQGSQPVAPTKFLECLHY